MAEGLIQTLQNGVAYSRDWPVIAEFNALFAENRVIKLTLFAQKYVPVFSVATVMLQLHIYGQSQLIPALAYGLFILSLPFQGYYWLGVRAKSTLPPPLHRWYQDIAVKMQQSGVEHALPSQNPRYEDLAVLLKLAIRQLDRAFLKQWF